MPTTPGGRWSPDDTDDWDLTVDLAAMQVSNEAATTAALNTFAFRKGPSSERIAFSALEGDYWSDTTDDQLYRHDGTTWQKVAGGVAVAAGSVAQRSVAASGSVTVDVTFPAGRFTAPPIVTVSTWGAVRDVVTSFDTVTATGFKLYLGSLSTVTRTFGANWSAVQMTPTSGAG